MFSKKLMGFISTVGLIALMLIAFPRLSSQLGPSLSKTTTPAKDLFSGNESATVSIVTPRSSATKTVTPQPTPTYGLFGGVQIIDLIGDKTPEQVVEELLLTNGGCELPCWWGIVPGKTTLATAQDLLQPVAFDFSKIGPFQYYVSFPYIQKIRFPEEWEQSYRFHIFRARVGANVVEQIYVPYYGDEKLAELIREYGKPRGVYYWSNGIDIGGSSSILIVDYSHRGILFVIDELSKLANANQGSYVVQTCPDKNTERNVALWLIAPSISPDHSNIADLYMDITGWLIELKSIETVTNVSADAIYQFALSETEFCFESALENWGDFRFGPTATP